MPRSELRDLIAKLARASATAPARTHSRSADRHRTPRAARSLLTWQRTCATWRSSRWRVLEYMRQAAW